ncbi:MAG: FAD-dependent oxidoreductase [Desulfovibrionaceae bacterium]|nr:FAD-dependent oxidoreductase [Desulfovibrionaceae bacterium]
MKCLEPARLGNMELRNRLIYPPMVTSFATEDGFVTDRLVAYAAERARGGVGLYTLEATYVDPQGRGFGRGVGIDDDAKLPGLKRLAEAVHKQGGKISVQLHHAGRETWQAISGYPVVGPSDCPVAYTEEPAHVLSREEIAAIVKRFADGARRAREAGFDAVEIHGAHGYLLTQFLSPYTNKRSDEYGGSLEKRARFNREVISAVRAAVGPDFTVTFRMTVEESLPGGLPLQEGAAAAAMFARTGALDAIHIVSGNYATHHTVIPPASEGYIINLDRAIAVRQAVGPDFPLILAGRIKNVFQAEDLIVSGIADFVAMGRALIADPELPRRCAEGKFQSVRVCLGCNDGCAMRTGIGLDTLCAVNPCMGFEDTYDITRKAERAKHVLVIGGGPAGMEAAYTAARRGHRVTLCEKGPRLGGQFFLASLPPFKRDLALYLFNMAHRLEDAGVTVKLHCEATVDDIRSMKADAVIVATGSQPLSIPFEGLDSIPHVFAHEVLAGRIGELGDRVAILGGGLVGAETAEYIARTGRHTSIIEMTGDIAQGIHPVMQDFQKKRLAALGSEMLTNHKVLAFAGNAISVETKDGVRQIGPFDTVVIALGSRPDRTLCEALDKAGISYAAVGDCVTAGRVLNAVSEGMKAAWRI